MRNAVVSLFFGLTTTLVFFFSIVLHEYAHIAAARRQGIQVLETVLYPFGGLARFKREPDTMRAEFCIAAAGPAVNFVLSIIFIGLMIVVESYQLDILRNLLLMFALLNFLIGVFNLFPGYPLDGGRVLRLFLWRRGKDLNEATILTARFGQIIGAALIVSGIVFSLMRGDLFNGSWTILIGFFLLDSAGAIIRETKSLEDLTIEQVMSLPVSVLPDADIQFFVDRVLTSYRQDTFPVARDGQLYGMLLLADLKKVSRDEWQTTKVQDVMRPVTPDCFVESSASLPEAKKLMRINGIGALGVIDFEGKLVGFMRRGRIKKRA